MTVQTMYDHIADAIAAMNPEKVLALHAPQAASDRLYALINKEKTTHLTASEKDELDHHLVLERLMRLAKAHARVRLASQ